MDVPQVFAEPSPTPRWALVDVVAAILTSLAWASLIAADGSAVPTGLGWTIVRYVAAAAACASIIFRWRFPAVALGVVCVSVASVNALGGQYQLNHSSSLALIPVALAVYAVVATAARRTAIAAVGAAMTAIEVGAVVGARTVELSVPAVATVGWLAAENVRARRVYMQGAAERAAEREREQARRGSAEERVRIARELHDVVAHAMSIIAVRSGVARMVLDIRPEEAREALGIIESTSRQGLQEMRLLLGVLRDTGELTADRGPAPGLASLPRLITDIGQAGVPVSVRVEGERRPLSPGVDLSAYRIIQEALTNVVRHAAPATAELTVRYSSDEVVIEVTDNGRAHPESFSSARAGDGTGHGIAGMRERVAVYGGKLVAGPTASGFRVLARIPTEEAAS